MAHPRLFASERPADDGGGGEDLVVGVHGTMDRHTGFGGVRRALRDVRTLLYDRRGYGRSRPLLPASDLDASVEDLLGLCRGLRVTVIGHSYGGCIALRAAEVAPDVVRAVVVYETTSWLPSSLTRS